MLIVTSLVMSALVVTASPAAAAQVCRNNSMEFVHPGPYPNTFVDINLCVISSSSDTLVQAKADIKWTRAASGSVLDEFEKFRTTVRLEYNNSSRSSATCDIKNLINTYRTGSTTCWTSRIAKTGDRLWESDGSVLYNINNDGRGDMTWNLTGSPRI